MEDFKLDLDKDINWDIFTPEEEKQLRDCYNKGDLDNLAALPDILITPDKELEIEKLVLDLREIDIDDESAVHNEIEKFWGEGGEITPEQEAEFQKKIDKEQHQKEGVIRERKREVLEQIRERNGAKNNEPNMYTLTRTDFRHHKELGELGFKPGDVIDKSKKLGPQSPKANKDK